MMKKVRTEKKKKERFNVSREFDSSKITFILFRAKIRFYSFILASILSSLVIFLRIEVLVPSIRVRTRGETFYAF